MANADTSDFPVRILVVEDYEPWRQLICSKLETHPEWLVVGEASNGLEAVQMAEDLKPDLILLDINLPELGGVEVADRICQVVPHTKILFVTQEDAAEVVRAALCNGALGYVLKADAVRELLPAIESALRGERFVSSGVRGKR